jgi:hypothetical protein
MVRVEDGTVAARSHAAQHRRRVDPQRRRQAQYTSIAFTEIFVLEWITASIGSVGPTGPFRFADAVNRSV